MKLVREIINDKIGTKWQILQGTKDNTKYYLKYFEFFKSCGWQLICFNKEEIYTKEYLQVYFDIIIED